MRTIIKNEDDRRKLIEYISSLPPKDHEVSIVLHRKKRTIAQNRLLHMWIKCISEETGETTKGLYSYYCREFLPWNQELVFGKEVYTGGSSGLNTKEFTTFLDNINLHASELGIYLPQPGQLGWDEFYSRYKSENFNIN